VYNENPSHAARISFSCVSQPASADNQSSNDFCSRRDAFIKKFGSRELMRPKLLSRYIIIILFGIGARTMENMKLDFASQKVLARQFLHP
jgi:hypothetical protein